VAPDPLMPTTFLGLTWIAALAVGLLLTLYASARTVEHTRALVEATRIPPFFIGITLLAVGTDLPEIANSIVSSFTGHGDLNAGDSIGSTVTQATLVLGLLPFFAAGFIVRASRVLALCGACIVGLAIGVLLMRDGDLSRMDGAALVGSWVAGSALLIRCLSGNEAYDRASPSPHRLRHGLLVLGFVSLVGVGSAVVVTAFAEISALLEVPEYLLSFFLASVGTSLPELVVDVAALRAGHLAMALGNTLGSSFVDSTLSIGIGPLFFPTAVTAGLAVTGSIAAIVGIGIVGAVLALWRKHNRITGGLFLALYVGLYFALLA
jgi:cation:H+ antiporter